MLPRLLPLLEHESLIVREEVLSLVFVKWESRAHRRRLIERLRSGPDFDVRSRAAGALAALSDDASRDEDVSLLRDTLLDRSEAPVVRKAGYEALLRIVHEQDTTLDDDVDVDEDLDLEWVHRV